MASLRSSRAALVEHISGTSAAQKELTFQCSKVQPTGNMVHKLNNMRERLPGHNLKEEVLEPWLKDLEAYQKACDEELQLYGDIQCLALDMSDDRELAKAELLLKLARKYSHVLAFDSTLITLDFLKDKYLKHHEFFTCYLPRTKKEQEVVKNIFDITSKDNAGKHLTLLSDSMSEGVNLPMGAAVVMLDQPSVLRVAEQRIGRIDRLNSPYDKIYVFWPKDKAPFILKKDVRLFKANAAADFMFGSNISIVKKKEWQDQTGDELPATGEEFMRAFQESQAEDKALEASADAFAPVRALFSEPEGLISPQEYYRIRVHAAHIKTKLSIGKGDTPWMFVTVRASLDHSPRWFFLEEPHYDTILVETELSVICTKLRGRLTGVKQWYTPEKWQPEWWDSIAGGVDKYFSLLQDHQLGHLSPRKRRVLKKAREVLRHYQKKKKPETEVQRLASTLLHRSPDIEKNTTARLDPLRYADQWLQILLPYLHEIQEEAAQKNSDKLLGIENIDAKKVILNEADLKKLLENNPAKGMEWADVVACMVAVPMDFLEI